MSQHVSITRGYSPVVFASRSEGRAVWSTQSSAIVHVPAAFAGRTSTGRRSVMHAVVRNYSGKGTKALFDLLEKNKGEVENLIRGVKGFVSYSLVRTTRGGFSVSVYQ